MSKRETRGRRALPKAATYDDFWALLPVNGFIYMPTNDVWDSSVVAKLLGPTAPEALIKTKGCSQVTWAPGEPRIIEDRVILKGMWRDKRGALTYNNYVPPPEPKGDEFQVGPWTDLGRKLYGEQWDHIEKWFAYRVQHPEVKINHALVLGSKNQGIGKDTLIEAVRYAVGLHNCSDQGARQVMTKVRNGHDSFLESVLLVVSEVHDLGEARFSFYDLTKPWLAAPPATMTVADKWIKQHPIMNLVGVIFTTNHLTDGLFLPAEDRRHYVAWNEDISPRDFPEGFWREFYQWYETGGLDHVTAHLHALDVSNFDPKGEPPKTEAFWTIVQANTSAEDAEMADALDRLGWPFCERPPALTLDQLLDEATGDLHKFLSDQAKSAKAITHRLAKFGYTTVRNMDAADGYWQIGGKGGKRRVIYALGSDRTTRDAAARALAGELNALAAYKAKHSKPADDFAE
jgi:hypothetical protein